MKKILLFLLLTQTYLFSQWSWINPTPQGNYLNHLIYAGNQKLIAIGDYGTLMTSSDDGINWNVKYRAEVDGDAFTSNGKLNDNTIFFGTYGGKFYKTTNSGTSISYISTTPDINIKSISVITEQLIFVLTGTKKVYKSTNGGANWNLVLQASSTFELNCISFFNSSTGCVAGGVVVDGKSFSLISQMFRTTNGGTNWVEYMYPFDAGPILSFSFTSSNTGYASGWGTVIKTTNAGANWTNLNMMTGDWIYSITFINDLTGYAGEYDNIYKTINGGANWIQHSIAPYYWAFNTGYVQSVNAVNPDLLYVLCSRHIIIKSTNSGTNWTPLTSGYYEPLKTIFFTNESTGYLGGWSNKIRKTINAGLNWTDYNLPQSSYIYGIHFTDVNTGFAVGGSSRGYIFKSTNAGINWIKTDSMGTGSHYAVYFTNNSTGFVLGYSGEIWRTSNSGNNWASYNSGVTITLGSICFADNMTGYACGGSGIAKIVKTTNAGINWNEIFSASSTYLYKIKFLNNTTGFACGSGIRKSTDGGSSWTQIFPVLNSRVFDFWLINNSTIYAAVETGKFYKTTNGGLNWYYADLPFNYFSPTLYFLDQNTGYLLSDQGTLLRTTNAGGPIGVNNISTEIPKGFSLSQNYPNPFNPSTTIEFEVSKKEHMTLSLSDITGRLIEVLHNGTLSPGRYSVTWDGTNYASGVYFYTLKTETFTQTKRMVLVK